MAGESPKNAGNRWFVHICPIAMLDFFGGYYKQVSLKWPVFSVELLQVDGYRIGGSLIVNGVDFQEIELT